MAISIASGFNLQAQSPNFERDMFTSIAEMKAYPTTSLPDMFICTNTEDGNVYVYNSSNTVDDTTGKWRIISASSIAKVDDKSIEVDSTGVISVKLNTTKTDNGISYDADGLYAKPANVATTSATGVVKPDGKTITIDSDGLIKSIAVVSVDDKTIQSTGTDKTLSLKLENKDGSITTSSSGVSIAHSTKTQYGTVKPDNKTVISSDGLVSVQVSKKAISSGNLVQEILSDNSYSFVNTNDLELSYSLYATGTVDYEIGGVAQTQLVDETITGTLDAGATIKITTSADSTAIFKIITNNCENALSTEDDGLMLNKYDNIASTTKLGFIQLDGDTITVDANGVATAVIGQNSLSSRPNNIIQLVKSYASLAELQAQTNGASNTIYCVPNGDVYDEYEWDSETNSFITTGKTHNITDFQDGIYIDEYDLVPVATTEKLGRVQPDGDTVEITDEGILSVNDENVAMQTDLMSIETNVDLIDVNSPKLVEYEEDELYDLAWNLIEFEEKPEYTTEELDAILDGIDYTAIGTSSGAALEMKSEKFETIWDSIFTS